MKLNRKFHYLLSLLLILGWVSTPTLSVANNLPTVSISTPQLGYWAYGRVSHNYSDADGDAASKFEFRTSTKGHAFWASGVGFFDGVGGKVITCLLYTSPSPRDPNRSRMPSSA